MKYAATAAANLDKGRVTPFAPGALLALALLPACMSVGGPATCSTDSPRIQVHVPITDSVPVETGATLRKLGYTVAANGAVHVVRELEREEQFIGIGITQNQSETPVPYYGVYVQSVEEGSPAALSGVMSGDIITELDGEKVGSVKHFEYLIKHHSPSEPARLHISRPDSKVTVAVPIGKRRVQQAEYQGFKLPVHDDPNHAGVTLGEITAEFAPYLPEPARHGAVVLDVAAGGPAFQCDLRAGDIITRLGTSNIELAEEMVAEIAAAGVSERQVPLHVVRGKQELDRVLEPNEDLDRPSRLQIPFILDWYRAPAKTDMNLGLAVANYDRRACYDADGKPYEEWQFGLALRLINYESRRNHSKLTLLWLIPWEF